MPQTPKDSSDSRPAGRASVGRASVPSGTVGNGSAARVPGARVATAGSSRGGTTYGNARKSRPGPKWGRIALVAALVLVLCGGVGLIGTWIYAKSVEGDLSRTDPFSALTGGRPPKTVSGSQNILLVGSDSRDPDAPTNTASKWRTDTMIILHIPSSQDHAYLISLPRDLYVYVPQDAKAADCGTRRAKINAAYSWGGMPLLVKTVECYTSVRMDHVMLIDFGGFKEVVDALGGVDLPIEKTIKSIHKPFRVFTKGTMHLDGASALDWVRQRYQFPDSDFARMRHQQQLMKALLDKAASGETLTNPRKLNSFLGAMTNAVTVDQQFSLIDMALQFRGLRSKDLTFLTNPHLGSSTIAGESVVVSDKVKASALYDAISKDRMGAWWGANGSPPPPSPSVKN